MQQSSIVFICLSIAAAITVVLRKLDAKAAVVAILTGFITWLGAGFTGLALLATFFIAGTLATSLKMRTKQRAGIAEQQHGQRTAAQVAANGGVAAILSLLSFLYPQYHSLLLLMIASSLSAATADTVSSETGNIYGSKFYNITSFKKDMRGLNGVVSIEGTLAGLLGSCLIAFVYAVSAGVSNHFIGIVIAGTAGNVMDSVLGATLERKRILNNNTVNFLNTLTGALAGWLLCCLFI